MDPSSWQITEPRMLWLLAILPLLWILRARSTNPTSPWRSALATLGRSLALAALFVGLSRPVELHQVPDRSVVVVVDASASLAGPRLEAASRWLTEAWADLRDEAQLVVLGERTLVTDDLALALEELERPSSPRWGTDLRRALELGLAQLSEAQQREVVLVSDGATTRGEIEEVLALARGRKVAVHAVHTGPGQLRARLSGLTPSQDRLEGEVVEVTMSLWADRPVEAEAELVVGEERLSLQAITLGPEPQELVLEWPDAVAGTHGLEVQVTGSDGVLLVEGSARVRVMPRPLAMVVGRRDQAAALTQSLQGLETRLKLVRKDRLPPAPWTGVDLLVLLDPELRSLPVEQVRALVSWVHAGGRLLVTGGQNGLVTDEPSVEPLADVLPVRFPKTKKKERAPLSVVYCLDSSDSMAGGSKFELAASALVQSLHLLPEGARVGVVTFADFPSWAVPLDEFVGTSSAVQALRAVPVRGGTSIFQALGAAQQALAGDESLVKHVVLLSDGQSTTTFARHGDVVTGLARRGITVSTIAVSKESDRPEMERIARAGQGRAYYAERFGELPRLFLDEMMMVTRTNKVEKEFEVHPVVGSRLLNRVPRRSSWPPLEGYVRGEQRPGSELALATADGHPVLVQGRYGRGSATVFTSDVGGDWSRRWANWEHHPKLWEGVLEGLLKPPPPEQLSLESSVEGHRAELVFEAVDALRNPRSDLVVEALVESPSGSSTVARLPLSGPGTYRARLELEKEGATLVRVAAIGTTSRDATPAPGGELLLSLQPGPPEEFLGGASNEPMLAYLARETGGRFPVSPSDLSTGTPPQKEEREELWPIWLFLGLGLLGVDLLVRRFPWPLSR